MHAGAMKVGSETDIPQISKSCGGRRLQCRPIVIRIAGNGRTTVRRPLTDAAVSDRCAEESNAH
jgi:hypothetical protein